MHAGKLLAEDLAQPAGGAAQLQYALAVGENLLRAAWPTVENPPVGGEMGYAALVVAGQTFRIPSSLTDADQAAADALYRRLTRRAPPALWDKLTAQREAVREARR